jgi:hypothetical protein
VKNTENDVKEMYKAHVRGDLDAVRSLLEARGELEGLFPEFNNTTWLHLAAEAGYPHIVDFWLERGWNVNINAPGVPESEGLFTALHMAKDAAMTRHLLKHGASVNACHRDLGTPLHYAIISAVEPSQKGRRRSGGANMDQIHALLEAGADLSLMNGEGKGFTPLAWAIELRRTTAEQVLREAGAPEKGRRPFGPRASIESLDLRRDFDEIYTHLVERVKNFDPSTNSGPGDGLSPVAMIEFGFQCDQAGWVALIFDTRENAEPDGEWNSFIEENMFERPHWQQARESLETKVLNVVLPDGTKRKVSGPSGFGDFVALLGDLLKGVLLKSRTDGVFKSLPKAKECHLGVEEMDGGYGWPSYEDRGKDDLA